MKKLAVIIVFIILNQGVKSQILEKSQVYSDFYPGNRKYDAENRLIRKTNRIGDNQNPMEFRTEVEKIFYYNSGGKKKAIAVLFSYIYDFDMESTETCHACFPEFEIAYYTFSDGKWINNKFIENWKGANGAWGNGAELEMKDYNKVKCLVLKYSFTAQGETVDYIDYYDIETLKKVKSIAK